MAVIRGAPRGGGVQLARYLTTQAENEDIRILDVCGRTHANSNQLRQALYSMSVTSELTKSDKGLYHAQINPAYGEDVRMSDEDWERAADILGKELNLDRQRRVIVLHTKKGRIHAHVAWERYDSEKNKMVSDSFSRLAQDRARMAIEQVFQHKRTPQRNANRPAMKQVLSDLWKKFTKGGDFIKAAKHFGYTIAAGVQRRPFMAVDETGRSFDLVRQLEGVKTKDVRERLRDEKLVSEKDAIERARKKQKLDAEQNKEVANDNALEKKYDKQQRAKEFAEGRQDMLHDKDRAFFERKQKIAEAFVDNRQEATQKEGEAGEKKKVRLAREFAASRDDQTQPAKPLSQDKKNAAAAKGFADSRDEITQKRVNSGNKGETLKEEFADNAEETNLTERESKRRAFMKTLQDIEKGWQQDRDSGRKPD